jgi:hypothetical protein
VTVIDLVREGLFLRDPVLEQGPGESGDVFEIHARNVHQVLKNHGVKYVVTVDPHTTNMLPLPNSHPASIGLVSDQRMGIRRAKLLADEPAGGLLCSSFVCIFRCE